MRFPLLTSVSRVLLSRRVLLSSTVLLTSSACVSGCKGWDFGSSSEPLEDMPAFSLSILKSQGCPLPEGVDPKSKRMVGIKVRLTSNHPGRVPANYFYASLLTRDDNRYLAELGGCEPVLSGAPLAPGESVEGFLNFPVPLEKTPDRVAYSPNLDDTAGADELTEAERAIEVPIR